ncbi:hypothetical protein FZI93_31335, partial [Mycobacterium sp. CBMA361]|nr:hypothetical protein [Mycolicibacterium sp. CBMA 361]
MLRRRCPGCGSRSSRCRRFGSGGHIAETALPWLRIAVLAVPAILMSMAGNGWLRGVQDTARP